MANPTRSSDTTLPDVVDANLADFVASYRETKHHILNTIAIWVAQAEMAKFDEKFYEKLAASVLERSEKLVQVATEFEEKLRAAGGCFPEYPDEVRGRR